MEIANINPKLIITINNPYDYEFNIFYEIECFKFSFKFEIGNHNFIKFKKLLQSNIINPYVFDPSLGTKGQEFIIDKEYITINTSCCGPWGDDFILKLRKDLLVEKINSL